MIRRVVCFLIAFAAVAHADSLSFSDRDSFATYLADEGLATSGENWDSYAAGTTFAPGTYTNGIGYSTTGGTSLVTNSFLNSSNPNSLGATSIGFFSAFDSITFSFLNPVNAFGININTFATNAGAYSLTTNNEDSALSGYDPFPGFATGQFVGLASDETFSSVTISGNNTSFSFSLDDLVVGREQSGFGGVFINGALINFGSVEGGIQFPLLGLDSTSSVPLVLDQTNISEEDIFRAIVAGSFTGASPHLYTGDEDPIDPDIQAAVQGAFNDLQTGGFQFNDYVLRNGRPVLVGTGDLSLPGSAIENMDDEIWLGFVGTFAPNQVFDPATGQLVPEGDFVQRLNEWWNDPDVQASVTGGSIEEVIFPHDPLALDLVSVGINIPLTVDDQGKIVIDTNQLQLQVAIIPEPGTVLTFGAALAFGAFMVRRRRRRAAA